MESSNRITKTIVLVTLLFAGVVQSAVIPEKDRWRQDESWAEEYNLVEPPPNPRMLLLNFFDKPKEKVAPSMGLKTIIKSLYQLNAFDDMAAMEDQNAEDDRQTLDEDTKMEEPRIPSEDRVTSESQSTPDALSSTSSQSQQHFRVISSNNQETAVPQLSIELTPPKENNQPELPEESTQSLGILLEDLVDTVHLPTHGESDRTEKFTHSFRYGYGIPFHPQGV